MENENIIQEQIQEQPEQVVEVQPEQQAASAPQQPQVDERERNFAALREAREKAERERDEAINYIRQLQQQNQPQEEADPEFAPDDLVEWKHVQNKFKKMEQRLHQYENQTAYQVAEARLKSQYNDFENVVTRENIEALRMAYPEIAQTLHATPDLYNKAVATYNIIKQFGIGHQQNNNLQEKQAIARNMAKPRSSNSVAPQQGESPLSKANEFSNGPLTEERKAQLYREMMQAKSNW